MTTGLLPAGATPTADTGVPYATTVLLEAVPADNSIPGGGGLTQFTATKLTQIGQGFQFGHVTYVPGDVASKDPETVSVNPIDAYTWGAAAYSARLQRCVVVVEELDRTNTQYGGTYWGVLPPGATCVGAAATPGSAQATSEPRE